MRLKLFWGEGRRKRTTCNEVLIIPSCYLHSLSLASYLLYHFSVYFYPTDWSPFILYLFPPSSLVWFPILSTAPLFTLLFLYHFHGFPSHPLSLLFTFPLISFINYLVFHSTECPPPYTLPLLFFMIYLVFHLTDWFNPSLYTCTLYLSSIYYFSTPPPHCHALE